MVSGPDVPGRSDRTAAGNCGDDGGVPTPPTTPDEPMSALTASVLACGRSAGLAAVGITTAEVLEPAASVLPLRSVSGLSADMAFTYRNPARSTDPVRALPGARSIVAGALGYRRAPVAAPSAMAGRVAHYAWTDHYGRLKAALDAVADVLRAEGHRAVVHADDNHLVDRNVAYRAGLGWYGKNANLLIPGAGSWFVLGSVLTDAPLVSDPVPLADGCATCRRCIDDCPTGAIVGPGMVDARRCLAWLVQARGSIPVEFRVALGDRIYGCDECQEVCPPNIGVDHHLEPSPPEPDADPWIDLVWLLTADDEALMARVGRWYLADRNPDVVRRTALVVLGNIGAGRSETPALIRRHIDAEAPLLRAHAVWAARRTGHDDLVAHRRDDHDPMVTAEFDGTVEPAEPVRPGSPPSVAGLRAPTAH